MLLHIHSFIYSKAKVCKYFVKLIYQEQNLDVMNKTQAILVHVQQLEKVLKNISACFDSATHQKLHFNTKYCSKE